MFEITFYKGKMPETGIEGRLGFIRDLMLETSTKVKNRFN